MDPLRCDYCGNAHASVEEQQVGDEVKLVCGSDRCQEDMEEELSDYEVCGDLMGDFIDPT